jgi:hypothetical protein
MSFEEQFRKVVAEEIDKAIPRIVDMLAEKMNIGNHTPTISLKEASEIIGVGMNKMYELVRREDFPCIKSGNKWLVITKHLYNWIEEQVEHKVV